MHVRLWIVLVGLVGVAACNSPTDGVETPNGTFPLVSVNGRAIPYDEGSIPPRPGLDSTCHILLVRGHLTLDARARTFFLTYDLKESCTGRVLGTTDWYGKFTQSGSRLSFISDLGEGKTDTRPATIGKNLIRVEDLYYVFEFSR